MYTETASAPAGGSDLQPGPQGHNGHSVLRVTVLLQHSAMAAWCRHSTLCWHDRSDSR